MKDILTQIVDEKRLQVESMKAEFPVSVFTTSADFNRPCYSLKQKLLHTEDIGVIAEFKRRSPSRGVFNSVVNVAEVTAGYANAGAIAVSVLTDDHFFGGSLSDLRAARKAVTCPILRKDFILDEYQVWESRYAGADAILLIAAILSPEQVIRLTNVAHQLGLEVVLEVHNAEELREYRNIPVDIIGVNNRNLKTFEVSIEISIRLSELMPVHVVRISESGIESPIKAIGLKRLGFHGILIGQRFMLRPDPAKACEEFIHNTKQAGNN